MFHAISTATTPDDLREGSKSEAQSVDVFLHFYTLRTGHRKRRIVTLLDFLHDKVDTWEVHACHYLN